MAAIDGCTREIVACHLETRSAFTARALAAVLAGLGIAHRRGGYRDPERPAFIESWFGKLKERCIWRHEFETLEQPRR